MRTIRDSERLPVRLRDKSRGAHVGNPDLDRPQALLAQSLAMCPYLLARRLGSSSCSHSPHRWLHVTYHDFGLNRNASVLDTLRRKLLHTRIKGEYKILVHEIRNTNARAGTVVTSSVRSRKAHRMQTDCTSSFSASSGIRFVQPGCTNCNGSRKLISKVRREY